MKGYLEITLYVSVSHESSFELAASCELTACELVNIIATSLSLKLPEYTNTMLVIKRTGYLITKSETLLDAKVRSGDVLILK